MLRRFFRRHADPSGFLEKSARRYRRREKDTQGDLRTVIWICYAPNIRGFVMLFARVQARIEAIEIAAHRSFFAVFTLSRYVSRRILRSTVGACVRH
jgi:hypothetical protein